MGPGWGWLGRDALKRAPTLARLGAGFPRLSVATVCAAELCLPAGLVLEGLVRRTWGDYVKRDLVGDADAVAFQSYYLFGVVG
jgi:hypothetical protein